jgi:iron complex transport system substrate-binding protein
MKVCLFLFIFFLNQAGLYAKNLECGHETLLNTFTPKYAKHFKIEYYKNYKVIFSNQAQYILVNNKLNYNCTNVINVPVKRIALTSTTFLPSIELIDEEKSVIGFSGKKYIYSNKFNLNEIQELGNDPRIEKLIQLKSELVIANKDSTTTPTKIKLFNKFNIPIVLNSDFEEESPLGRAEWIVFNSSFFNKEEKAKSIFKNIEKQYLELKEILKKSAHMKRVLVGEIQNGKWAIPGGLSDLAIMIKDAGGEMLFAKPTRQTQYIPLEEIIKNRINVDVWLTHNNWTHINELNKNSIYKFVNFKSIFNYNKKVNIQNANDYWEMGMQRPDLMLNDLKNVFSENLKDSELIWYKKL